MAHLAPSLSFLKSFKAQMEQGCSIRLALEKTIKEESTEFSNQMLFWRASIDNPSMKRTFEFPTHFQKAFSELLHSGMEGAPIYEPLCLLEKEMEQEFERQWKTYLEKLPLKLSLPLLLFFFPAYVILLFGPLITQFLQEVN